MSNTGLKLPLKNRWILELANCMFCKSVDCSIKTRFPGSHYVAQCLECLATGAPKETKKEAAEVWNACAHEVNQLRTELEQAKLDITGAQGSAAAWSDEYRKANIAFLDLQRELEQVKKEHMPEGYKIVPIEPTERMIIASQVYVHSYDVKLIYEAMLSAADEDEAIKYALVQPNQIIVSRYIVEECIAIVKSSNDLNAVKLGRISALNDALKRG